MTVESGSGERTAPVLPRVVFGTLPLLAAVGPLLTAYKGLFAFRLVCAFIIVYALMFLLGRGPWRMPDVMLLATSVVLIVSGLFGLDAVTPDSDNPYSEYLSVALGLLTALAARGWQRRDPRIYLSLCRGWVVAALFACAVAAAEVVTGRHLPGYLESSAPDPAAGFGNPNALAVFLVMATIWAMPVLRAGGPWWRATTWVLFVASAPALVLTGARLAMVTWLAVLAAYALLAVLRPTTALRSFGATLLPLGAAAAVVAMTPRLVGYLDEIETADSSGGVREELTRQGLQFSAHQWGLPAGPGGFERLIVERGDLGKTADLVNAHDMWVEMLVQYGALSLLLFLGWLVSCIVVPSGARAEIGVGVVALLVLGLVDSSLLDDASLWLFVITLAVASRTGADGPSARTPLARTPPARERSAGVP